MDHSGTQRQNNNLDIQPRFLPEVNLFQENIALNHDLREAFKGKLADGPEPSKALHILFGHVDHLSVHQVKFILLVLPSILLLIVKNVRNYDKKLNYQVEEKVKDIHEKQVDKN